MTLRRVAVAAGALLALVAGHVALYATPAHAAAGNVWIDDVTDTLYVEAGDGHANDILVDTFPAQGQFQVRDNKAPLTGTGLCGNDAVNKVSCPIGDVDRIVLRGRDLHDLLGVRGTLGLGLLDAEIEGGSGNDTLWVDVTGSTKLYGQDGNDSLKGGAGPDVLDGGSGTDSLWGKGGDDTLVGGPGNDTMSGGPGIDTVSYAGHTTGVFADADGIREDDGAPGEHDTILADVEHIGGGRGNDHLTGSADANQLAGGPGDDTLVGMGGGDLLLGEAGVDLLLGDGPTAGGGPTSAVDTCVVGADGGAAYDCEAIR